MSFLSNKTVDGVLKPLYKAIEDLSIIEINAGDLHKDLMNKANAAAVERDRASKLLSKLESLVNDD